MSITRQLIFGIDPYASEAYLSTYSFADIPDANTTALAFTCGFVPSSKSSGASLVQETIWLGTTSGIAKTYRAFDDALATDGSTTVTATAITQRLDPDARVDSKNPKLVSQKRYLTVNFNGPSPLRTGVTMQLCVGGNPISGDPVTWLSLVGKAGDTLFYCESARGGYVHLKFTDASTRYNEVVIPPYGLAYEDDGPEREQRTT